MIIFELIFFNLGLALGWCMCLIWQRSRRKRKAGLDLSSVGGFPTSTEPKK